MATPRIPLISGTPAQLTNLVDPTDAQDAATKNYVDTRGPSGGGGIAAIEFPAVVAPAGAGKQFPSAALTSYTNETYMNVQVNGSTLVDTEYSLNKSVTPPVLTINTFLNVGDLVRVGASGTGPTAGSGVTSLAANTSPNLTGDVKLRSGTNITLTQDAPTNSITISSSGGSSITYAPDFSLSYSDGGGAPLSFAIENSTPLSTQNVTVVSNVAIAGLITFASAIASAVDGDTLAVFPADNSWRASGQYNAANLELVGVRFNGTATPQTTVSASIYLCAANAAAINIGASGSEVQGFYVNTDSTLSVSQGTASGIFKRANLGINTTTEATRIANVTAGIYGPVTLDAATQVSTSITTVLLPSIGVVEVLSTSSALALYNKITGLSATTNPAPAAPPLPGFADIAVSQDGILFSTPAPFNTVETSGTGAFIVFRFTSTPSSITNNTQSRWIYVGDSNEGRLTYTPTAPVANYVQNTIAANSVNSLDAITGNVSLIPGTGIGISSSLAAKTITITNTGSGSGITAGNTVDFTNDQFGQAGITELATESIYIQIGFTTATEVGSGGTLNNTTYWTTPNTAPTGSGNGIQAKVAVSWASLGIVVYTPSYSIVFSTPAGASANNYVLDRLLFAKKNATGNIYANANLWPPYRDAQASDDVQMIPVVAPTFSVVSSGTNQWTASVGQGVWRGSFGNYNWLASDLDTEYVAYLRIAETSGAAQPPTFVSATRISGLGGIQLLSSLAGTGGATPSLQQILNIGNSANTTSPNVASIILTNSATTRSTTLSASAGFEGPQVVLDGSTSGSLSIKAAANTTSYSISWPAALATTTGQVLSSDTSGNLSWTTVAVTTPNLSQVLTSNNSANNINLVLTGTGTLQSSAGLQLNGTTSGNLILKAAPTTTSYSLTWPAALGAVNQNLTTDAAGTLSWTTPNYNSYETGYLVSSVAGSVLTVTKFTGGNAQASDFAVNDGCWGDGIVTTAAFGSLRISAIGTPTGTSIPLTISGTGTTTWNQGGGFRLIPRRADFNFPIISTADDGIGLLLGTGLSLVSGALTASAGSPGGTSGQFQYNNGTGGFAGAPGLTYNATNNTVQAINPPVNSNDVARLSEVQAAQAGIKPVVPFGTIAHIEEGNLPGTYTNNSGVGSATFVGTIELSIANAIPAVNDWVVLVAQTAGLQNGSYVVTANTASGFTLTRTNITPAFGNFYVATKTTATNFGVQYENTNTGAITVGTTAITFSLFGVANGANIPTLEQVTTAGARTPNNTFFGPNTGNAVGIGGSGSGGTPIISAVGAIVSPADNINLSISGKGTGVINLASQNVNFIRVSGAATNIAPTISAVGTDPDVSLDLASIGNNGTINLGTNFTNYVQVAGSSFTTVNPIISPAGGTSGTPLSLFLNAQRFDSNLRGFISLGQTISTDNYVQVQGAEGQGGTAAATLLNSPIIRAAGNDTNAHLNLFSKGSGSINLASNYTHYLAVVGSASNTPSPSINSVGTLADIDISLIAKGTGAVIIDNGGTATSLKIINGTTVVPSSAVILQTTHTTATTAVDIVLRTQSGGWFYPIGDSVPASFTLQPKISLLSARADGTNIPSLGPGTLGQAIISGGQAGSSPYWGTPTSPILFLRLSSATGQIISSLPNPDVTILFDTVVSSTGAISLNYASATGTITATSAATYIVTYQGSWASNATGSRVTYLNTSNATIGRIGQMDVAANNNSVTYSGSAIWMPAANETATLRVWQNSGASLAYGAANTGGLVSGWAATLSFVRIA